MHSATSRHAGFTLIELMIAMVISLIVAAAAIQLFQHSLSAVNKANEIQRRQQTLLATVEHLLPRLRQASTVTANPGDPSEMGILVTRNASATNPGHDCTGASVTAGAEVTELYYSNGEDLLCDSNSNTAVVAFDISSIALNRSYEDTSNDGRGDTTHTNAFPEATSIVGIELSIEQPLPDGGERVVPLHVALRNNTLAGRNQNGDFENASES